MTGLLYKSKERTFVKRDSKTKELLELGSLSPILKDYIIDGFVPKLLKHFCGRDNELQDLDEMLKKPDIIKWLIKGSLSRSILGGYCID